MSEEPNYQQNPSGQHAMGNYAQNLHHSEKYAGSRKGPGGGANSHNMLNRADSS